MKVIDCPRYGPPSVVRIVERPIPPPGRSEVLVRVVASTVTTADARVRGMRLPSPAFALIGRIVLGFRGPRVRVLGTEFAGEVHAVDPGVSDWKPGDRVVGTVGACFGAHAEFIAVDPAKIVRVPDTLAYDEAVSLPFGTLTALYFLDVLARIGGGYRLLILGGTGAVGVAAIQIAAHRGAVVHATARTEHTALVRALGAKHTIDHTSTDPLDSTERYDGILDTCGAANYARARHLLKPDGVYLPVVATFTEFRQAFITRRGRVRTGMAPDSAAMLKQVMDLAAAGVLKPVIGARFDMEQIVDAYTLVDSGHKLGSAVLRLGPDRAGCRDPYSAV